MGGKGNISVVANVVPRLMSDMCLAATAGERERAERLDADMQGLHTALFMEANPIPVKWALQDMGWIEAGIRLPLTPLAEHFHDHVREALRGLDLLRD